MPPFIVIKCQIEDLFFERDTICLNEDCSIKISKDEYGIGVPLNIQVQDLKVPILIYKNEIQIRYPFKGTIEVLPYLGALCRKSFKDIEPKIAQLVQKPYWENSMTFEPYSIERERKLIKIKKDYDNCFYHDFEKIGNWLVISGIKTRDYCVGVWKPFQPPFEARKSHLKFFIFLLTHPNLDTFPYLFRYLIGLGFIAYLFIKIKKLRLFFINIFSVLRPNKFNIYFTVLSVLSILLLITLNLPMPFSWFFTEFFLVFFLFFPSKIVEFLQLPYTSWGIGLLIFTIIEIYIVACLIIFTYSKFRRRKLP